MSSEPVEVPPEKKRRRACRSCADMKVKCIPKDKDRCERCHQLGKECIGQTPGPRKRRTVLVTARRIVELERKLDALTDIMGSSQQISSDAGHLQPISPSCQMNLTLTDAEHSSELSSGLIPVDRAHLSSQHPADSMTEGLGSEDKQAERQLSFLRELTASYFPFVVVPKSTSASELQHTSPFLWDTATMLTSSMLTIQEKLELGKSIMDDLITRLLKHGEQNLSLLQGLLLFAAWNHLQFTFNPQMTNLVCLAKALAANLQLDRAPGSLDHRKAFTQGSTQLEHTTPSQRSLAETRAFLGCYYLTLAKAVMGQNPGELYPSQHASYVEDCCRVLEEGSECLSDSFLVGLVRLQIITENISRTFPRDMSNMNLNAPVGMLLSHLGGKLKSFKDSLPEEVADNAVLLMHYYAAEVHLYEVGLRSTLFNEEYGRDDGRQLETLFHCVKSARSYFNLYCTLPESHYAHFPFSIWAQSGLVLLTAVKLSGFEHEAWDVSHVRTVLGVSDIIDHEIKGLEALRLRASEHNTAEDRDIFDGFLQRMQKLKIAYHSRVKDGLVLAHSVDTTELNGQTMGYPPDFDPTLWGPLEDYSAWLVGVFP